MQRQPQENKIIDENNIQCQQEDRVQSIQQVMHELQILSDKIDNNHQYPLGFLKDYITIYVQNHNRSQQFFNLMCQHNMLAKLFSGISRPIFILQIFNLLLANTQQSSQLVYIFSHPLFHNYLLINFENIYNVSNNQNNNSNSQSSTHQCIEYYIQLLKTIIMKLQTSSELNQGTLLKLFCNSKYSSFPLLTNCIMLAIKRNIKQQLVRVTAQHCILQLVEIIVRKKIGEHYLYNIHMVIFFYQIIHQTIIQQTIQDKGKDTTIKYIIDLLKAISQSTNEQTKQKSYLLFFTILSNLIVFKFLKNPAPGLHLLFKLSNSFSQIQQLYELPQKYLCPIYFIFAKHLFNKYLNNVSLSSIILLSEAISELKDLKDVNILKLIKTYYQKSPLQSHQIQINRQSYSQDSQKYKSVLVLSQSYNSYNQSRQSSISLNQSLNRTKNKQKSQQLPQNQQKILKQIQKYMLDNQQFFELKQNYYKKSSNSSSNWFFNFNTLFKKMNVFQVSTHEYIKKLCHLAAIKYQIEKPIKFTEQIFSPTSIYIYQYLKLKTKTKYYFGQKTQDTQKIEISFNQNRDQFLVDKEFLKIILTISELILCEVQSLQAYQNNKNKFQFLQKKFNKNLSHPGQIYFILHFRQFFQHSLSEFICTFSNINYRTQVLNFNILKLIYKISYFLHPHISQLHRTKFQNEILKIEKQLYTIIKEKGFSHFYEYLESQKQKKLIQQLQKNDMQSSMIKFSSKQSFQSNSSSKKKKSTQKKRRSIFSSSKSDKNDSPSKNLLSSLKTDQNLKIVQCKMLHLQLLRYLLRTSQSLIMSSSNHVVQKQPLHKLYSFNFIKRYTQNYFSNSKNNTILCQFSKIKFSSEEGFECSFRIRVNYDDLVIFCQIFYQNKLILKCNIKQFNISQPYSKQATNHNNSNRISLFQQNLANEQNGSKYKGQYIVNIESTMNTLGFMSKQQAYNFSSSIHRIKLQEKQIKDMTILQYINKEDQNVKFQ